MILETQRTTLTLVSFSDKNDIQTLYQNEAVRKYLGGCVDALEFSKKFEILLAKNVSLDFVVRTKINNFVGLVNISPRHHLEKEPVIIGAQESSSHEVSYQLDPLYWNQGLVVRFWKRF